MMAMTPPPGFIAPPAVTPTREFPPYVRNRADVLMYLTRTKGWLRGAELGTAEGRMAASVLSRCLKLHLTTVDLWRPQPQNNGPENWTNWPHDLHEKAARSRLSGFGRRVKIIKDWTANAAERIEDGSLDFVFIDADHSETGVRGDIKTWTPKIKGGGMLMGHDASWVSVKAAIDDLCPGYWTGPDNVWGIAV